MDDRIRRTAWFGGMVQGVGFRYTACSLADDYGVTGYVRNLPDGRVELVAESSPAELDRFVAAVREAINRYIRDVEHLDGAATGEFRGVGVRY